MEPTPTPAGGSKLPLIIGGVIVVLAVGGYVFMGKGPASEMMGDRMMGDDERGEMMDDRTSLKGLLGRTGSQKCTFDEGNDLSRSSGTFYTSGGKGRGDFESSVATGPGAGTVMKSHMIVDGNTFYVWDDTTGQGMKMMMDDVPTGEDGASTPGADMAKQWNEAYAYECDSWRADPSVFVPPANVSFMDFGEMMKGMMPPQTGQGMQGKVMTGTEMPMMPQGMDLQGMKAAQCAACEQAGEQKAQCLAALGCK